MGLSILAWKIGSTHTHPVEHDMTVGYPELSSTELSSHLFEPVCLPFSFYHPLRAGNGCYTQSMETTRGRTVSWLEKVLPVPGLLLTTFLAIGLFASKFDHWASSQAFAVYVNNNRSTLGLIVQVISQFLGLTNVYALSKSAYA